MYLSLLAHNPFLNSFLSADLLGQSIYLGLFLLSVISWTLLIGKFFFTRRARANSQAFMRQEEAKGQHPLAWKIPESENLHPNCFALLYQAIKGKTEDLLQRNRAFSEGSSEDAFLSSQDLALVDTHAASLICEQTRLLEKNLFLLPLVFGLAPLLGLLGTVWGILMAFSQLQKGSVGGSQLMMEGLSMALATTVLGLLVAIPALIAHSYLKNLIRDFTGEMASFASNLVEAIELQYRKGGS